MLHFTITEVLLVLILVTFSRTESLNKVPEDLGTDRLRLRLKRSNAEDGGGKIILFRNYLKLSRVSSYPNLPKVSQSSQRLPIST